MHRKPILCTVMKIALIIALSSLDRAEALVVSPPAPYSDVLEKYKRAVALNALPPEAAERGLNVLEVWTRHGRQKHHRFQLDRAAVSEPVTSAEPDPAKTDPAKTDPAKTDPAKTDPAKTDPAKTDPAKTDPAKTDPEPASGPDSAASIDGELAPEVLALAARFEAGETVAADELGSLTVPQLEQLAARYEIAIPSGLKKAEVVDLLLADEGGGAAAAAV